MLKAFKKLSHFLHSCLVECLYIYIYIYYIGLPEANRDATPPGSVVCNGTNLNLQSQQRERKQRTNGVHVFFTRWLHLRVSKCWITHEWARPCCHEMKGSNQTNHIKFTSKVKKQFVSTVCHGTNAHGCAAWPSSKLERKPHLDMFEGILKLTLPHFEKNPNKRWQKNSCNTCVRLVLLRWGWLPARERKNICVYHTFVCPFYIWGFPQMVVPPNGWF